MPKEHFEKIKIIFSVLFLMEEKLIFLKNKNIIKDCRKTIILKLSKKIIIGEFSTLLKWKVKNPLKIETHTKIKNKIKLFFKIKSNILLKSFFKK